MIYLIICRDDNKYVIFRENNANHLGAFKNDLSKINWAEIPGLDDPSCAYETFIEKCVVGFSIQKKESETVQSP